MRTEYTGHTEYRLISSHEPDLFQERLNRFVQGLGPDVALGEMHFSTTALPNGTIVFSALVAYKHVEGWQD
jgi:hypothetical protein